MDLTKESAQYVKGVGPRRFHLLNRLGIQTVWDLLTFYPSRYEDRSQFLPIARVKVGEYHTIKGEVLAAGVRRTQRKGMAIFEVVVSDGSRMIYGVWFNQVYLKEYFHVGDKVILYGKVEVFQHLQMNSPEFEILTSDEEDSLHMGRIVPIYPLTQHLTQRPLRSIIRAMLDRYLEYVQDPMPPHWIERGRQVSFSEALEEIHFPLDFTHLKRARERIVFQEFFFLQLAIALRRQQLMIEKGIIHSTKGKLIEGFFQILPFELTSAQKRVMTEVADNLSSPHPMNRLLEGEVGSGKTVVAIYALLIAVQGGYQAVLMAPTEILAEQHYRTLQQWTESLRKRGWKVSALLITGSLSKGQKSHALSLIRSGEVQIVVGTHSLIEEKVQFHRLGLVVIDEQHRFGVFQRASLMQKGENPDVLVMTATPIPRTLAMSVYGDLDISILDELPPGRKPIKSYWIDEGKRERLYEFIRQKTKEGRQVYIVYPLIEESEKMDLKAAVKMYKELAEKVFLDLKIGLLHGKIKPNEKERIMEEFRKGVIQVLVSTMVIEVGIDVPNATLMVIEHPERFGLSQLHQLRGRIGRGEYESYCVVMGEAVTEQARARLSAFVELSDGFRIAEKDLEIRGPGEFLGFRQHGMPELKLANLIEDREIMDQARQEAQQLLEQDPLLKESKNQLAREELERSYAGKFELALA